MFGIKYPQGLLQPWKDLTHFSEELYAMFSQPQVEETAVAPAQPASPVQPPLLARRRVEDAPATQYSTLRARPVPSAEARRQEIAAAPATTPERVVERMQPAEPPRPPQPAPTQPIAIPPLPPTPDAGPVQPIAIRLAPAPQEAKPAEPLIPPQPVPVHPIAIPSLLTAPDSGPIQPIAIRSTFAPQEARPADEAVRPLTKIKYQAPQPQAEPLDRPKTKSPEADKPPPNWRQPDWTKPRPFEMPDIKDCNPFPTHDAAAPTFMGKVDSGSYDTYQVILYPNGPLEAADPIDPVEVKIPTIHLDEKIDAGTWLFGIFRVPNLESDIPPWKYWAQPPIWMP